MTSPPLSIYLDYNATSPIRPEVREAIAPFFGGSFGNASSIHSVGRRARAAIESARQILLAALGDPAGRIVFTSGGTEANNLALKGVMGALGPAKNHLILSAIEHQAVLQPAQALAKEGIDVTLVASDRHGFVDPEAVENAIRPSTGLISVMHANNEVGTIQKIKEIAGDARRHGALFHTDAVQSFGKIPVDAKEIGADLVSLSAHKLGGPKGTGALYLRSRLSLEPLFQGGPHEGGLRAGTENVAGIVGMGTAAQACLKEMKEGVHSRIGRLRDQLERGLKEKIADVSVNGHPADRLDNTLNMSFPGCEGETLVAAFDLVGICVSTGSACSSGSMRPSHVLVAMGLPEICMRGSIRFSLGWGTTEQEIQEALEKIPAAVEQVRRYSKKDSR